MKVSFVALGLGVLAHGSVNTGLLKATILLAAKFVLQVVFVNQRVVDVGNARHW